MSDNNRQTFETSATAQTEVRASIRAEIDGFIQRCPIRRCAYKEGDKTIVYYGFLTAKLKPQEERAFAALLFKLTKFEGKIVSANEEHNRELRFVFTDNGRYKAEADYMYFGIEIESHPTKSPIRLRTRLPTEEELQDPLHDPGRVYLYTDHLERRNGYGHGHAF